MGHDKKFWGAVASRLNVQHWDLLIISPLGLPGLVQSDYQ
jgi:hypothetical protein